MTASGRRGLQLAGGLALLLVFYGPLLAPGGVLAVRDLPRFHLPLRTNLQQAIAEQGLPRWDAALHGGQPILSNPNYAAFYPATWLTLPLPPARALHLTLLLHALLGMAGASALARHLGCRPVLAVLAVVAFTGGGAVAASTNTFTLFCGLAWWPWITLWGDRTWRATDATTARRWTAITAAGLTLQLLAGEPVTVFLSGLTLAALAVDTLRTRSPDTPALSTSALRATRAVLVRLVSVALLAALLAGIQLVPTALRLTETARSDPAFVAEAGTWSMAPARLAEVFWPHVHGDPNRAEAGLYFGSHLHDGNFPYVISIYPGLLLALLGLCALLRWKVPRVLAWRLTAGIGLLLALGRHLPVFPWLQQLPPLNLVRYPEKFILVTVLVLGLAGVLGLELLLRERDATHAGASRAKHGRALLPLGFAAVVTTITATIALLLWLFPDWSRALVSRGSLLTPSADTLDFAAAWLQSQWLWATLWAAASLGWLAWLWSGRGSGRGSTRALAVSALLLVCLDLGVHARGTQRLLPLSRLTEPPAAARQAFAEGGRLFSDLPTLAHPDLYVRRSDGQQKSPAELGRMYLAIERLEPYLGTLWGLDYVFHPDYDRMLTHWGQRNLAQLRDDWQQNQPRALRLLGAWSVGTLLRNRPLEELLQAQATGTPVPPVELRPSPFRLPRVRPVPEVRFHDDADAALQAARADGYRFPWLEHVVCSACATDQYAYTPRPRLLAVADRGHRVEVDYRSEGPDPVFLVFARTFDAGWRARVETTSIEVHATASGQVAVEAPAGEHRLVLSYRQPGLLGGVGLSLLGLAICAGLLRSRPRN